MNNLTKHQRRRQRWAQGLRKKVKATASVECQTVQSQASTLNLLETKHEKEVQQFTLSLVFPASIIDNAQSFELKTYLVSQIARAASIFCIDEIIVIRNRGRHSKSYEKSDPTEFCVRNLEYLETPQYLRRALFPVCPELKYSGLMNPLNTSHHFRSDEWCQYREGVVIPRPSKKNAGSWVNIGFKKDCQIDMKLEVGTRVTVKLEEQDFTDDKYYKGKVVSSTEPREVLGQYWGYQVRVVDKLEEIITECPYEGGYDVVVGTSDKGELLSEANFTRFEGFKHAVVYFGGLEGIEGIIEEEGGVLKPSDAPSLFNMYLNTCPGQGTNTIRTEEAILVSLAGILPCLKKVGYR